ncbi:MAG TPA: efflux RND transporter periplasmic adaptor subunit [Burkholderiaceae bacterium]
MRASVGRLAAVVCLSAAAAAASAADTPVASRSAAQAGAVPVVLKPVEQVVVHPLRDAQAAVVARNESRLSAEVSARVWAVEVEAGQTVKKGQVLVRLDPDDAMLALERARAQRDALAARLALATAQLERASELRARGFISVDALAQRTAEVDALRAELRAAEVQARIARSALDKTVVRAPFDAAVRARHAQVGELAAPGTPLVTLSEQGAVEVSAAIAAEDAAHIAQARAFRFEGAARSYDLRLLRLAPVADRATRTREARFAPQGRAPIAGAEGRLTWSDPRPHLPPELVVRRAGRIGVFVADGPKARFVALEGAQEGRPAPVPGELGGQVVVSGQQALQDGTAIAPR